jgi:hypothetical protein
MEPACGMLDFTMSPTNSDALIQRLQGGPLNEIDYQYPESLIEIKGRNRAQVRMHVLYYRKQGLSLRPQAVGTGRKAVGTG